MTTESNWTVLHITKLIEKQVTEKIEERFKEHDELTALRATMVTMRAAINAAYAAKPKDTMLLNALDEALHVHGQ